MNQKMKDYIKKNTIIYKKIVLEVVKKRYKRKNPKVYSFS